MNSIKIKPSQIRGTICISGSKNSSLPIIAASLLNNGQTTLKNVPNIKDIDELILICNSLGGNIIKKKKKIIINSNLIDTDVLHESCKTFRASYYLMGVYLALFKRVKIYLPGGCNIGSRPIDYHLDGFQQLGCDFLVHNDIVEITMNNPRPAVITLPKKSLGATINLILVATSIEGLTTIKNTPKDPELIDFITYLQNIGADITIEENTILINGGNTLSSKITHSIIPDRIEAATFVCLGLVNGKIKIKNINLNDLDNILKPLLLNNAKIKKRKNIITIRKSSISPFDIISAEYPNLSTDIFPVLLPVLVHINSNCTLQETIYESRFEVCKELVKLGANIQIIGDTCIINGFNNTFEDIANATDLRCAASLLIFALSINREITITNFQVIHRGYSDIFNKLEKLKINYELY